VGEFLLYTDSETVITCTGVKTINISQNADKIIIIVVVFVHLGN